MRNIVIPEPLTQNGLFDTERFGWWHTQLAPEAFRRLSNGMEGVFRASILKLMPAAEIGEAFDPQIGRPTKELRLVSRICVNNGVPEACQVYDTERA